MYIKQLYKKNLILHELYWILFFSNPQSYTDKTSQLRIQNGIFQPGLRIRGIWSDPDPVVHNMVGSESGFQNLVGSGL